MLTGLAHAYDGNHLVNPSYTGDCIRVSKADTGSFTGSPLDVGFVDGKIDRNAIVTFSGGDPVYRVGIFDQIGTRFLTEQTTNDSAPLVYDGTNFVEDSLGRIKYEGGSWLDTPDIDVTGSFSLYARMGQFDPLETRGVLFGFGDTTSLYAGYAYDANSISITNGFGSPKSWINGTDISAYTGNDLYQDVTQPGYRTIAFTNCTNPTTTDEFRFKRAAFRTWESADSTLLIYDRDTEADHTEILSFIDDLYVDVQIPSVTFTDALDAPIVGADVTWIAEDPFAATDPQWTNAQIVGSNYVTDGQGVATYDPNTDPAVDPNKVYTAVARYLEWDGSQWVPTMGAITAQNNVDLTAPV